MKQLVRTTDPTLISYLQVLLKGEGIETFVLDMNASVLEGSIGVLPRRVMVIDDDYSRARVTLFNAGLRHEISEQS